MISGKAPYYSSYRQRRTVFLTIPTPLSDRIQMPDNSLYVNTESGIRKSGGGYSSSVNTRSGASLLDSCCCCCDCCCCCCCCGCSIPSSYCSDIALPFRAMSEHFVMDKTLSNSGSSLKRNVTIPSKTEIKHKLPFGGLIHYASPENAAEAACSSKTEEKLSRVNKLHNATRQTTVTIPFFPQPFP